MCFFLTKFNKKNINFQVLFLDGLKVKALDLTPWRISRQLIPFELSVTSEITIETLGSRAAPAVPLEVTSVSFQTINEYVGKTGKHFILLFFHDQASVI